MKDVRHMWPSSDAKDIAIDGPCVVVLYDSVRQESAEDRFLRDFPSVTYQHIGGDLVVKKAWWKRALAWLLARLRIRRG